MKLNSYRSLGRSGLFVSPLALGALTFGTPRWGSPDDVSEAIFNAYIDAGGNFIDTADGYAKGRSEELVGEYITARGLRDQVVLATKFTFNTQPGNPNAGGNGRKNIHRALEASLRRLQTDYVDLYWLHAWDLITPVEEILQSLGDLVRAGKIRYFGFSDVPAWYAAKAATLASAHALHGPIALQLEYSLSERGIEREHVPAAREFGLGITPWSPLAAGFLAGKYTRNSSGQVAVGGGRLDLNLPSFQKFNERNWHVLGSLRKVAQEAGLPMARVALAWAAAQPGMTSLLLGVSKLEQLHDNLASLELQLSPAQLQALDEGSALEVIQPYTMFTPAKNRNILGGGSIVGWPLK
ncbi:aldo/keto reductase [Bryobacter aggregatus]|uniref:aldo/keto reductase n=1 Tax=Bryobacter aggregatus TaxID=360054 RepID=UPI0004E28404|nr:aldo/keto reductase [Bryobacter aggregatus]